MKKIVDLFKIRDIFAFLIFAIISIFIFFGVQELTTTESFINRFSGFNLQEVPVMLLLVIFPAYIFFANCLYSVTCGKNLIFPIMITTLFVIAYYMYFTNYNIGFVFLNILISLIGSLIGSIINNCITKIKGEKCYE